MCIRDREDSKAIPFIAGLLIPQSDLVGMRELSDQPARYLVGHEKGTQLETLPVLEVPLVLGPASVWAAELLNDCVPCHLCHLV